MKKVRIVSRPTKVDDFTFDDLWNEINIDWQGKAERLQARRWRQLKRNLNSY